jgi:hypothetical protein
VGAPVERDVGEDHGDVVEVGDGAQAVDDVADAPGREVLLVDVDARADDVQVVEDDERLGAGQVLQRRPSTACG